jgi:hypothetical protein
LLSRTAPGFAAGLQLAHRDILRCARACPVLTFAIKPENFVDDGEAAYVALKEKVDAEKAAKRAAKKAGLLKEEEEDEE